MNYMSLKHRSGVTHHHMHSVDSGQAYIYVPSFVPVLKTG